MDWMVHGESSSVEDGAEGMTKSEDPHRQYQTLQPLLQSLGTTAARKCQTVQRPHPYSPTHLFLLSINHWSTHAQDQPQNELSRPFLTLMADDEFLLSYQALSATLKGLALLVLQVALRMR